MKLSHLYLVLFLAFWSCQPQKTITAALTSQQSLSEYSLSPDESILRLIVKEPLTSNDGVYSYSMEVVRQLKSGSGFKNRIASGSMVTINSKEKVVASEVLAVVEASVPGSSDKLQLKLLLRE